MRRTGFGIADIGRTLVRVKVKKSVRHTDEKGIREANTFFSN